MLYEIADSGCRVGERQKIIHYGSDSDNGSDYGTCGVASDRRAHMGRLRTNLERLLRSCDELSGSLEAI